MILPKVDAREISNSKSGNIMVNYSKLLYFLFFFLTENFTTRELKKKKKKKDYKAWLETSTIEGERCLRKGSLLHF